MKLLVVIKVIVLLLYFMIINNYLIVQFLKCLKLLNHFQHTIVNFNIVYNKFIIT